MRGCVDLGSELRIECPLLRGLPAVFVGECRVEHRQHVGDQARHEGGLVVITVRDHGPGFAAADLEHVFERFWRAGTVRRKQGVGLGLYMVRRVVELHGGSVRAGNAVTGGAEMTVTLPVAPTRA